MDDESQLRRVAEAARVLLPRIVPGEQEARGVDQALASALALTGLAARRSLRKALLSAGSPLRPWALGQLRSDTATRLRSTHYLNVHVPEQARVGEPFSAMVKISLEPDWQSIVLKSFTVPPEGALIVLLATAPDLTAVTDTEYEVPIAPDGDSELIRFSFRAAQAGTYIVHIYAFLAGQVLGHVAAQVAIGAAAEQAEALDLRMDLNTLSGSPGQATLIVDRAQDNANVVHFRGEWSGQLSASERRAGDPAPVVERIIAELNALADGSTEYKGAENQSALLRELGIELWSLAIPEGIRRQFWQHREKINALVVLSDLDDIPWEFLYPLDQGQQDHGFLVEQFPVLRGVPGQRDGRQVGLLDAMYVISVDDLGEDEIRRVRDVLRPDVIDRGDVRSLAEVRAFLAAPASVLHFAGHNQFSGANGSRIQLDGGPFTPSLMTSAAQLKSLETVAPVVFFNACRTAGQMPALNQVLGWASRFIAAGACVFLGTAWDVRDDQAADFAVAFYEQFVKRGLPLGEAVTAVRRQLKAADGDPTWLAYTVFGSPSCTVEAVSETAVGA